MAKPLALVLAAAALCAVVSQAGAQASGWSVVSACWRPDENPFSDTQVWDNWIWAEGWREEEQFWPKYFKPAGSVHIILRNDSSKAGSLELADLDGEPFERVVTNPKQAGRLVWRWFFPQAVQPGQWVECKLRLRGKPKKDILVGLKAGEERVEVRVPVRPNRVRLESVSFSSSIDKMYLYLRSLDGRAPKAGRVRLDLGSETACNWLPGPRGSGLAFAEVALNPAWKLGSFHLVEISLADGSRLAYPVRAWDSYFVIGLFGDTDPQRVREAVERNINSYVHPRETALLDQLGVNYLGWGRERIPGRQSGKVFHYVFDEPDAHDIERSDTLPYMDRLGLLAQMEVFARFREEIYPKDQTTPCMLLVDNTFKPQNYYVYGQCMDVYCSDPYVPLGGDQCEYIARAMECARDASTPRPVIACLWATTEAPPPYKQVRDRPPTPEEERLMVFYALGSGSKGVLYFADRGETRVSANRPLWDEIGRINADILALSPYLAIGCPAGPQVESGSLWYRSLMCGADKMVVVAVNKGHHIGYNTLSGFRWHFPLKNASVSIPLPAHFRACRVQEVKNGSLVPFESKTSGGRLLLRLDVLDTARAFVISRES